MGTGLSTRRLGKSGLTVSALGLGCMGMSQSYGPSDDAASVATIQRALELGVTLLDTADVYGAGHNEGLVGRAISGKRDSVVVATKFALAFAADGTRSICGRPDYVRSACEASLRRLRVEYIDLYYQHRVDPAVPIEDTVGAMAALVEQGKVRHLGLSEVSADSLDRAAAVHPISALQSEWSLWTRDLEDEVLPVARRLGIGLVPYSPLGRGFLTGTISGAADFGADDMRNDHPRFHGAALERNRGIVDQLATLATSKGITPGQLALAWILAQGPEVVPIPGTKRIEYLEENLAAEAVTLTREDLRLLERAAPREAFTGARYGPGTPTTYGDSPPRTP